MHDYNITYPGLCCLEFRKLKPSFAVCLVPLQVFVRLDALNKVSGSKTETTACKTFIGIRIFEK